MLMNEELSDHLQMIDKAANELYDRLIEDYKLKRNITEELKEKNQMEWFKEMNNIENCIVEIILNEIIYSF